MFVDFCSKFQNEIKISAIFWQKFMNKMSWTQHFEDNWLCWAVPAENNIACKLRFTPGTQATVIDRRFPIQLSPSYSPYIKHNFVFTWNCLVFLGVFWIFETFDKSESIIFFVKKVGTLSPKYVQGFQVVFIALAVGALQNPAS